ncbi:phosphoadenosine phosphosulfate reductase [Pseudoruegeria sp. SHC-113]|uniref:phosphoadenosine phosphosulfate reductase n=1 Tax=Pseudoruegeria sp. SHC-113 TaxID=2855439 RepID=UPI0021BB0864|nr:phosphoadenosine phosphosulfate reductase [Pseudoruegeria sp. SHC-113]MCT8160253.1 phosphoadenosine phosphosulfate reductase [Pseudoruegeria sp. SHC-113]
MDDETVSMSENLSLADRDAWLERIDDIGEERGYFQPLGPKHSAIFTDESPTLLVTFETIESIAKTSPDAQPLGFHLVEGTDWSQLCILAHEETWFRDRYVYGYFDRLVDDGFFEDFDRVIFYGAGACGYAAAAFSVAAPGATVISLQPQATLDPQVTAWDTRFKAQRRLSFTDRYGYAPDMVEGAGKVFVMHDPAQPFDAMHAALFTRPHVQQIRCRHMGPDVQESLQAMEILTPMIRAAAKGDFSADSIHRLLRARRAHGPYLEKLTEAARRGDKPLMTAYAAEAMKEATGSVDAVRKHYRWARNVLAASGRSLEQPEEA